MAKPEWGVKRECQGCGARFYDMKRDPIVCPKCETVYVVEVAKPKPPPEKKVEAKPEAAAPAEEKKPAEGDIADLVDVDVDDDEESEDESFVEDASELEEDTDASLGIETDIKPAGET